MSAFVFAPAPWRFVAFPLVIRWQARFDALAFYFPDLQFGLVQQPPAGSEFTSLLKPPRQQGLPAFSRHFQPGELSQWQAYLNYLAAQDYQEESDLQAAIRGQLGPVLPKQVDRDVLWSLAYQLEQLLAEEAAQLHRLASQEQALEKVLAEDLGEEEELASLKSGFPPALAGGVPDPDLARLRFRFWREVLAPHLSPPWAAVVLEALAGESSLRHLWEAGRAEGGLLWQAEFRLPDWPPQPDATARDLEALELGVAFRKTLGALLQALQEDPQSVDGCREEVQRLVAERLWPAAGLPEAQALRLEVCGWQGKAPEGVLMAEPMLFLTPAG